MLKIHTSAAIWEWQSISLKRSISLRCCGLALFSKCVYKNSFLQICGYLFVPVHIFISFHWNSPLISSCNERQKAFRNLVMHLQKSCSSPCLSRGDNSGTKLKTLGTGGGGNGLSLIILSGFKSASHVHGLVHGRKLRPNWRSTLAKMATRERRHGTITSRLLSAKSSYKIKPEKT